MTDDKYRGTVEDLVYLLSCTVNGAPVDGVRAGTMDLSALYEIADRHLLTGITAMALENAGIRDEAFTQAKGKAIRKVAAMDMDRAVFLDRRHTTILRAVFFYLLPLFTFFPCLESICERRFLC